MNSNIDQLVREMNPRLNDGKWVFCTLPVGTRPPENALAVFREKEATTVVISAIDAESLDLPPRYVAAWITLTVYSDLDAVGFLAVISRALAAEGISCNVISAVHHDHLFVPYEEGARAIEVLRKLQEDR
jgi:uncharacterized protein